MVDRVQGTKAEFTPQMEEIKAMGDRTWRSPGSGWPREGPWSVTSW